MKKILVVMTAVIMVFSMAACGSSNAGNAGEPAITAVLEIDYPDDCGIEDVETEMQLAEGTSAMDMLYQYAEENDIELTLSENSPTVYFTAINGVAESADAGWVYEVDDEMSLEAADELIVTEGMEITWDYMSWSEWSE